MALVYETHVNILHKSHIFDTVWIGHAHSNPYVPQHKTQAYVVTLGTAVPVPADVGLNLDDEGYLIVILVF
jgi:hypothetical protein